MILIKNLIFLFIILTAFIRCGESDGGNIVSCESDQCGHCPSAQTGLKICTFVASPTQSESVTLFNYTSDSIDLDGYSILDENGSGNMELGENLGPGSIVSEGTFTDSTLSFTINDCFGPQSFRHLG